MRLAIDVYVAARRLLDEGYTIKEIESTLNVLEQPTYGYVYIDELPTAKIKL